LELICTSLVAGWFRNVTLAAKSRSLDEHLDLATARRALQIAEKIPARFAPVAVNAVTLARNVVLKSNL